jgi:hypothetical protein
MRPALVSFKSALILVLRTTARIVEKSHRHFWHGNQGEANIRRPAGPESLSAALLRRPSGPIQLGSRGAAVASILQRPWRI